MVTFIHYLPWIPTGLVWAGVRLNIPTSSSSETWETIHRARWGIVGSPAKAASHHISQVCPEWRCVEAVDDGVTTCVQVTKDKQYMVYVFWCLLDDAWLEPVPDPQDIVGGPTDYKGRNDYNGHLESLHASFGYHVCSTASQAVLSTCKNTMHGKMFSSLNEFVWSFQRAKV